MPVGNASTVAGHRASATIVSPRRVHGATGVVLTKIDGSARGGIVLAIYRELKLPVLYVGVGEAIDDLVPFDPSEYARALLEGEPAEARVES